MRSRARQRSIATSIRRSRGVRRTGATLISAMILPARRVWHPRLRQRARRPKASTPPTTR